MELLTKFAMSTLESASDLLRWIARTGRHPTVSDTSLHFGWPKSSTSRLLKQMLNCGLLERDVATLAYRPALLMLELGRQVQTSTPVLQRMAEELEALVRSTGHTGYISVLDESRRHVVVLRVFHGTHALRVVTEPGRRLPAASTSTGRALLARLDDTQIAQSFPAGLETDAATGPQDLAQLGACLQKIRSQGWAVAFNEALPGVGSISCAIGNPASGQTWAFCLSFPVPLDGCPDFVDGLVQALVERARRLGQAAGDPGWKASA